MNSTYSPSAASWSQRWNDFWFTPRDPATLGLIRLLTGIAALIYLLSWVGSLTAWFGPTGLLTGSSVAEVVGTPWWRLSYLYGCTTTTSLWIAHAVGIVIVLLMAIGWKSRVTTPLSLIVILAYVHRAPLVAGLYESIIIFLLAYLSLGPNGATFSLDAWIASRRDATTPPASSWSANVALRLIQVHLAAIVLLMAATKLAGEVWWNGMAIWWLITRTEVRLVDLTGLHETPGFYLANLWTHAVVAIELSFPALVWFRSTRRVWCWLLFAELMLLVPITGNLPMTLVVGVALVSFASAETPRRWWDRLACSDQPALSQSEEAAS